MITDELLKFDTDIPLRRRLFSAESFSHPAKLHLGLLQWVLDRYTRPGDTVADPMAGIGSILLAATQERNVVAREIEPRWLDILRCSAERVKASCLFAGHIDTGQADAREPWGYQADHIVFSPPYACRASSNQTSRHYVSHKMMLLAKEQGISYTQRWHQFASNPTAGAAGAMTFFYGEHPDQVGAFRDVAYWQAMSSIYRQALTALRPSGYMVLIIKDHIKDGKRVMVCDQTAQLCREIGFEYVERHARLVYPLSLWQRRRKERGEPVIEDEQILVFTHR